MRDLIFISMENWDEVWRRNQFLCASIARRFPDTKILFVGLQRNVARAIRGRALPELFRDVTWTVPEHPGITVTRPIRFAPDSRAWGRRCNEIVMRRHVKAIAHQIGVKDPLLWLNPHYAVHMAGEMGETGVIYDITDDWALAAEDETLRSLIEEQDHALCGRADLVIVCSEALKRSRVPVARNLLLLPNGVDPEHYRSTGSIDAHAHSGALPAPVFGYTGTLHQSRIDVPLILELAQAFPDGSVALIGPDHMDSASREALRSARNVYMPGPVSYAEIPRRMAEFDACIVPHVESPFTESLNPLKLWEYLAFGKPIVSTNVAGFRDYPNLCRIASGPSGFIAACRDALAEDGRLCSERRSVAERNSWESRVDELLDALAARGLA